MSRRFSIDENSFFGNITVGQVLRTSSKELKNKAASVLQCVVLCQLSELERTLHILPRADVRDLTEEGLPTDTGAEL
ncbi:hypothetical protein EYF80_029774 [Liparis tanakae]|uniref:Uncharacterized protein n=1 Tax=Liparis tanakae TaxID=230148 RepID=A0A4Z2H2J6_9TELE|nr:hypothetical protein EYF80_029774 [Liparis tanakae]